MAGPNLQRMILCGGMQSGGTTLVSWCILQRRDTNGVLDMPNDIVRVSFDRVAEPILWVKMTVGAFRWLDLLELYTDLGWRPEPLLIVRDTRMACASLTRKPYGANGTTGGDPPLRVRFRRFLSDWEVFRANGWPIVKFEDLLRDERAVLEHACRAMGLPWDEGVITWPKKLSDIAYVDGTQKTFAESLSQGSLTAALRRDRAQVTLDHVPLAELEWLDATFAAYNGYHGYPERLAPRRTGSLPPSVPIPRFEGTALHWYLSEIERLKAENDRLHADRGDSGAGVRAGGEHP
ncbi:MAG TPA: hypothetical protein VGN09_21515 [Vicinamibacteria bacterium]